MINGTCQCINGYIRYTDGTCRACPRSSTASDDDSTCICNSATAIYIYISNLCIECGANSIPNAAKNECICKPGYQRLSGQCISLCPT